MKLRLLVSLLPAAMAAEFDKCARTSSEWIGVDQVPLCQSA
jgi:hypothetical protein